MGSFEKVVGLLSHFSTPETAAFHFWLSECNCEKVLAGDMHVLLPCEAAVLRTS